MKPYPDDPNTLYDGRSEGLFPQKPTTAAGRGLLDAHRHAAIHCGMTDEALLSRILAIEAEAASAARARRDRLEGATQ